MRTKTTEPAEVRNTKQRRAVTAELHRLEDFISTQDLHRRLQDQGESVSLATTYRILQSMAELGQVDVLRTAEGEAIYRRCEAQHHHHHLVCRSCGATVELEAPDIEAWAENTARRHGYTDVDHTVEISGICEQCAARLEAEDTPGSEDRGATLPGAGSPEAAQRPSSSPSTSRPGRGSSGPTR